MKKHAKKDREERREERPRATGSRRDEREQSPVERSRRAITGGKDHANDLDSDVRLKEKIRIQENIRLQEKIELLLLGTRNEAGSHLIYEVNHVDYHQEVDMMKVSIVTEFIYIF